MKIIKGTLLKVNHDRKGIFTGIATEDFDTDDTFYTIAVAQEKPVEGNVTKWYKGNKIPCRASLCRIEPLEL